jgi:hypothetical protein
MLTRKRAVKKALKQCVEKHKKIYRRRLVALATGSNRQQRQWALCKLAEGTDVLTASAKAPRHDVPPGKFKEHFENLFSRKSEQETLGLTEAKVGPKSQPRLELSGPPDLFEVQHAIGRLHDETAPGANGLRSEIFKAGGAILAHRLQHDFELIWPKHDPNLLISDSEGREDLNEVPLVSFFFTAWFGVAIRYYCISEIGGKDKRHGLMPDRCNGSRHIVQFLTFKAKFYFWIVGDRVKKTIHGSGKCPLLWGILASMLLIKVFYVKK